MKKALMLIIAGLLAVSLSACATTAHSSKMMKVKCPACGYQFEVPAPTP